MNDNDEIVTIDLTVETAEWLMIEMGARAHDEEESGEVWHRLREALGHEKPQEIKP